MCTVLFLRDYGLLSKNRDKSGPEAEELVRGDGFLAMRTVGAGYYSLGLNRHGCAFVSTAVNSPEWTRAVVEGRHDEAAAILAEETRGLTSPTVPVSAALAEVRSVEDWIAILTAGTTRWRGYNVVMVDGRRAVRAQVHGDRVELGDLAPRDAVTNHFTAIPVGPRTPADYPSSFERLDYARSKLPGIGGLADLEEAIHPADAADRARIWRTGAFATISSAIVDIGRGALLTASSIDAPFITETL